MLGLLLLPVFTARFYGERVGVGAKARVASLLAAHTQEQKLNPVEVAGELR
jgi:hypothetical protein